MSHTRDPDASPDGIEYHPYAVLVCHLTETWAYQGTQKDPAGRRYRGMASDFTRCCQEYYHHLEAHRAAFFKANGDAEATKNDTFPSYLYNPFCCASFGHSDMLAAVLVDGFDPLTTITGHIRSPVKQAFLGLCPLHESLGLRTDGDSPFSAFDDLLDGSQPEPDSRNGDDYYTPTRRDFESDRPLVILTRFKLSGLVVLGNGLLVQEAVFRAMGRKILEVLAALRDSPRDEARKLVDIQETGKDDLNTLQCAFVDLQGSEEIGTLMICRNYSVAMALVVALRTLTIRDLFAKPADVDDVKHAFENSNMHKELFRASCGKGGMPAENGTPWVDNHVFSSTYTTLGVSFAAFMDGELHNCHGYVEAYTRVKTQPGHHLSVCRKVEKAMDAKNMFEEPESFGSIENYHRTLVGQYDRVIDHTAKHGRDEPLVAIRTRGLVNQTRSLLNEFAAWPKGNMLGADLMDFTTSVFVPFPRLEDRGQEDLVVRELRRQHGQISRVLKETKERLFGTAPRTNGPRTNPDHDKGAMDVSYLREKLRELRVPRPLIRTIGYLYQNFAHCFGDRLHFESCLDLYDAFATLYVLLTKDLPEEQEALTQEHRKVDFFDEYRVEELSRLADALDDALRHRIYSGAPGAEARDIAVDFRGGLNQVVAAADVPLKCGLGILKRAMEMAGDTKKEEEKRDERRYPKLFSDLSSVGSVARIAYDPRTLCDRIMLGSAEKRAIARVHLNVHHHLHPSNLSELIHETGHILFAFLCAKRDLLYRVMGDGGTAREVQGRPRPASAFMAERLSEIFACLISHLLIFEEESELFLRYSVGLYSLSRQSTGIDESFFSRYGLDPRDSDAGSIETFLKFAETVLRIMLVTEPIRRLTKNGVDLSSCPRDFPLLDDNATSQGSCEAFVMSASDRFRETMEEAGPFFSEYARLTSDPRFESMLKLFLEQLPDILRTTLAYMPRMWGETMAVYDACLQDRFGPESGPCDGLWTSLGKGLSKMLDQGRPFVLGRRRDPALLQSDEDEAARFMIPKSSLGQMKLDGLPAGVAVKLEPVVEARFVPMEELRRDLPKLLSRQELEAHEELILKHIHSAMSRVDDLFLTCRMFREHIRLIYEGEVGERRSSLLRVSDILDWPGFCSALTVGNGDKPASPGKRVWGLLSSETRTAIEHAADAPELGEAQKRDVVRALNGILMARDLHDSGSFQSVPLSQEMKSLLERDRDALSKAEVRRLNRLLLEASFPEEVAKSVERRLHLFRNVETGTVGFPGEKEGEKQGWDDFLLDRASGVIFCVSPHMRGKRLKHQTAILKTLWDVSTMLRAWRLEVILKATWPRTDEPGEP